MFAFITWNPDPVAFHLLTWPVKWYSLCWATALLLGYYNMGRLYKKQHIPDEVFAPLLDSFGMPFPLCQHKWRPAPE